MGRIIQARIDGYTNSISTLSYNGTVLLPFSKGAWGLNTETDVSSYESFKDGSNDYDMRLIYSANKINPEMTAKNIIQSIDSRTTYFMIDHLCDIIGKENCNTAFFNTIVLKQGKRYEFKEYLAKILHCPKIIIDIIDLFSNKYTSIF